MAEPIRTEIDVYQGAVVSLDDLQASCDRNFEMILWPLINPAPLTCAGLARRDAGERASVLRSRM